MLDYCPDVRPCLQPLGVAAGPELDFVRLTAVTKVVASLDFAEPPAVRGNENRSTLAFAIEGKDRPRSIFSRLDLRDRNRAHNFLGFGSRNWIAVRNARTEIEVDGETLEWNAVLLTNRRASVQRNPEISTHAEVLPEANYFKQKVYRT